MRISDWSSDVCSSDLGVNMGTRFIATQEAPVHQNVKDALLAASELDTRLIMRPLRNTERVLVNAGVERLLEKERTLGSAISFADIAPAVAGRLWALRPLLHTHGMARPGRLRPAESRAGREGVTT